MPILGLDEGLPRRPRRVLVAGTSGSGKTTMSRRIAAVLGIPHFEIDSLFHGPEWRPNPAFVEEVERFSSQPEWVTEWQYSSVRPLLAERAELVVWLDYSRAVVMSQVVRRTVRRRVRREVLWNDNVEPPLRTILSDPEHIIRWAWSTHGKTAERVQHLLRSHPGLPIVRLVSRSAAQTWLANLANEGSTRRCATTEE